VDRFSVAPPAYACQSTQIAVGLEPRRGYDLQPRVGRCGYPGNGWM